MDMDITVFSDVMAVSRFVPKCYLSILKKDAADSSEKAAIYQSACQHIPDVIAVPASLLPQR
jgi:hypothetical protein